MKICHIFKITGVSGAENHLLTLASHLNRSRYRLTFCLLVERGPDLSAYIAALEDVGVEVVRFPIRADLDPLLFWRLVRFLRATKPDIVHTHLIHGDLYGTLAARLAGVPVVVSTKHNDDAFRRSRFYAWLSRLAARGQDRIIAISEHLARFSVEVEGLDAGKITYIHYGLDGTAFCARVRDVNGVRAEFGVPADAPLAGVVARLDPQKGHAYLLRAWAQVTAALPEARLLVVGDGPLRGELQQQARDLDLENSVIFTGRREDVPRLMAVLDVVALPSLWEGFGLVLLEAMAVARPIVASRVSAIPEIVVDGETGLLVPPRDVKALAAALIELLRNSQRAAEMGRRGRARLEQEFTVERMVAQTEAVYEQVGAIHLRKLDSGVWGS
jgi:glycosyltransferase involved in cell wall biosynthesis